MDPTNPNRPEQEPAQAEPIVAAAVSVDPASPPPVELIVSTMVPAEPAPAPPQMSDEERQRLQKNMQDGRTQILALLLATQRPKPATYTNAVETYEEALRDAPSLAAEDWQELIAAVLKKGQELQAADLAQFSKPAQETQQQQAAYSVLFEQFVGLEQLVAAELARMKDDQEQFQKAPQELRDLLLNYKKGIEIIQRMIKRLQDRKKPLPVAPSLGDILTIPEAAVEPAQWTERMNLLCTQHHDWRAARTNAMRDVQKAADTSKKEVLAAVKNLLGALDGIEGGLRSEPEILARMKAHGAEHEPLIDAWFHAYQRLDQAMLPFFLAIGLEPKLAELGVPFHPDTMEPGGTVSDPSRKNEDVAAVLRRGYALNGELIRPILVEVVVNSTSEAKE